MTRRVPPLRAPQPEHLIWECLRHFAHLDHSNAAVHMQPVRFSPITFRLAEHLKSAGVFERDELGFLKVERDLINEVLTHVGTYAEDKGR